MSTATADPIEEYRRLKRYQWSCNTPDCDGRPHQWMPHRHARSSQVVKPEHAITAFVTGRGYGKTRAGAEWAKSRMMSEAKHRLVIVVPTFAVGRDVCIEGESGLLAVIPPEYIKRWNRSNGELVLTNGAMAQIFGANTQVDAESIRGYQAHSFWAEELGSWRHQQTAWDMARFGLRLGTDPRTVVTTTPRPTPVIKRLLKNPKCFVVNGSTFENADNLPEDFKQELLDTYANTRLGQQEIDGLLLDDVIGALWSYELIQYVEALPTDPALVVPGQLYFDRANMRRIVVAVDPAGSHKTNSDETGIVVVGIDLQGRLFVLDDVSGRYSPDEWAKKAIEVYHTWEADCVVAEANFGGDMVESNLRNYDGRPRFKLVHASRGKAMRAEPVIGTYEQKRTFHVGVLAELEAQMVSWVPPGQFEPPDNSGLRTPIPASTFSPDRVDALVWAIHELALQERKPKPRSIFVA